MCGSLVRIGSGFIALGEMVAHQVAAWCLNLSGPDMVAEAMAKHLGNKRNPPLRTRL